MIQVRAVTRETIKVGFLDLDGGAAAVSSSSSWVSGSDRGKGTVDLDLALEYTINQVLTVHYKTCFPSPNSV